MVTDLFLVPVMVLKDDVRGYGHLYQFLNFLLPYLLVVVS